MTHPALPASQLEDKILEALSGGQRKNSSELIDEIVPGLTDKASETESYVFEVREAIWRLLSTYKIELSPDLKLSVMPEETIG